MESEREDGARILRQVDELRARTAGMPRGHAVLQLAYTLLLAGYMGVFVYTGSTQGGASAFGGTTMTLVLPPIIMSSTLVSGANERFRERLRMRARDWVATGFFSALLLVILVWGIAGGGYQWWVSLIAFAVTLLAFGVRPLSYVLRSPASKDERASATRHPLPRPVRLTTILIGVYMAVACAVVLVPVAAWLVMMLGLGVALVALSARGAIWGLLRTGYEWRLSQWVGFGIATTVMFLLAVLIISTDVPGPGLALAAGAVVAASIIVSALVPGRSRDASEA